MGNLSGNNSQHISTIHTPIKPGPFLARVISHLDKTYMGKLQVELLRQTGNTASESQVHQVSYMSPFYGVTNEFYVSKDPDNYDNTQKSYGMWMVPPDVGTTVVVIFIDGDVKRGYWIGCVQDDNMNFMYPGIAATQKNVEGGLDTDYGHATRVPVAEYNKKVNATLQDPDGTRVIKPLHPFANVLKNQGLLLDDTRGITTSSARREVPSMVFGISTPGPLDKKGKRGPVGKKEWLIPNAPVSRLGGSSFVMDDGDDKFLRKKSPSDGPPEYASVEDKEKDGDVTRPHNELIRLRTRTGHQILLHNSEDLIYITNSRGTSWIEFSSDGKIDIYAQDSISIHTDNDLNLHANRDINLEAGRNINMKATADYSSQEDKDSNGNDSGRIQIESYFKYNLIVGSDGKIMTGKQKDGTLDVTIEKTTTVTVNDGDFNFLNKTGDTDITTSTGNYNLNTQSNNNFTASGTTNILSSGDHIETASNIHMNGPQAATASTSPSATTPEMLSTFDNPTEVEGVTITSIMLRIPTSEPYPHHEHLDPTTFKTDKTDRESGSAIAIPSAWKKYTTATDTLSHPPPKG